MSLFRVARAIDMANTKVKLDIPNGTLVEAWDVERKYSVLGYYQGKTGGQHLIDRLQGLSPKVTCKFKYVKIFS